MVFELGYGLTTTDLSIATTITHEIIHAYLLSVVDGYNVDSTNENTPSHCVMPMKENHRWIAS
jgi:hypothetical protein